jgi:hypothetical protein
MMLIALLREAYGIGDGPEIVHEGPAETEKARAALRSLLGTPAEPPLAEVFIDFNGFEAAGKRVN